MSLREPFLVLRPVARSFGLIWRAAAGLTIARLVLLIIQGILPVLALYVLKLIVDAVHAGVTTGSAGDAFVPVAWLVGAAGGVALVSAVARALSSLTGEAQMLLIADHISEVLHAKAIQVDLQYYEQPEYYDALHQAQAQASSRANRLIQASAMTVQNAVSLLGVAGLLISFDPLVALVLLGAVVPGVAARMVHSKRYYRFERGNTPAEREAGYFNRLITENAYAKEMRIFHLGPVFRQRFQELRGRIRHARLRLGRQKLASDMSGQILAALAVFGAFALVAWRTLNGQITLGDMVMYFGAFQRGQDFFRDTLGGAATLYEDNLFLSNVYEFLDLEQKVKEPVQPKPVPRPLRRGIEFHGVAFRYPRGDNDVLRGVDLVVRPGEHVALVGHNGSGKTTLVKLLCRLYDVTGGSITIDGVDLREFETAALRREISVVFQDYARYNLTARENIAFGDAWSLPDEARIRAAAQHAGADEVISRLKHGYDAVLGHLFRHGAELSIGEWQKIALARAFLRDSPIIVFDEPTSALDARAEYDLFQQFHRLSEGRAAILISHRMSTVRMADRIYVLENGRIVEAGDHEELVERGGTYARLFETQARYYQ